MWSRMVRAMRTLESGSPDPMATDVGPGLSDTNRAWKVEHVWDG